MPDKGQRTGLHFYLSTQGGDVEMCVHCNKMNKNITIEMYRTQPTLPEQALRDSAATPGKLVQQEQ